MQPVGILGSISSHGGTAITASTDVTAEGIGVVRQGDLHACPILGHGVTAFTSTATEMADGLPVVRLNTDAAGCGAVLVIGANSVVAE